MSMSRTASVTAAIFLFTLSIGAITVASQAVRPASTLVGASNTFGLKLFHELQQQAPNDNLLISPASVVLAFAMVYNGADGSTKAELDSVLAFHGMSADSINDAAKALTASLMGADTAVELSIANSVWAKPGFPFTPSFLDITDQMYGAKARPLTSTAEVNQWVADATHDKITQVLDEITPDLIMVLINAIYFKGDWTSKFDSTNTRERDFTLLTGEVEKKPLMEQHGDFAYFEDSAQQVIKLPYGNRDFCMMVLLPREGVDFKAYVNDITPGRWQRLWRSAGREWKGTIALPKFEMKYGSDLTKAMEALGATMPFSPDGANFRRMFTSSGDTNVYISEVLHKTYLKVDEQGSEAAAVTAIKMKMLTSVETPLPSFMMIVDRPFVCAIVDDTTGLVLFIGAITNPGE